METCKEAAPACRICSITDGSRGVLLHAIGAHFSLQRFLPLVMLGVIFGSLLARTRSLAPCVLLHALWNAYIFWQLTCRGLAGA